MSGRVAKWARVALAAVQASLAWPVAPLVAAPDA